MERDLQAALIPSVAQPPTRFDELQPGQPFTGGPRSISRADIHTFTAPSGDRTGLRGDESYARTTSSGGVVAHGAVVLSVATGLAYQIGMSECRLLAIRSMDVRFDRPIFPGDSPPLLLTVSLEDRRPQPDRGRVADTLKLRNQHDRQGLTVTLPLAPRPSSGTPSPTESSSEAPRPPV